jgi:hypothetical protein
MGPRLKMGKKIVFVGQKLYIYPLRVSQKCHLKMEGLAAERLLLSQWAEFYTTIQPGELCGGTSEGFLFVERETPSDSVHSASLSGEADKLWCPGAGSFIVHRTPVFGL